MVQYLGRIAIGADEITSNALQPYDSMHQDFFVNPGGYPYSDTIPFNYNYQNKEAYQDSVAYTRHMNIYFTKVDAHIIAEVAEQSRRLEARRQKRFSKVTTSNNECERQHAFMDLSDDCDQKVVNNYLCYC